MVNVTSGRMLADVKLIAHDDFMSLVERLQAVGAATLIIRRRLRRAHRRPVEEDRLVNLDRCDAGR